MKIHKEKVKGQGLIEYIFILFCIGLVVIVILLAISPLIVSIFCLIASKMSAPCIEGSNGITGSFTNSIAQFIPVTITSILITCVPVALMILSCFLDKTIKLKRGELNFNKKRDGVISSRLCFSAISLDIGGITTVVQNSIIVMQYPYIILLIIHIIMFSLCANGIKPASLRVFFVIFSIVAAYILLVVNYIFSLRLFVFK